MQQRNQGFDEASGRLAWVESGATGMGLAYKAAGRKSCQEMRRISSRTVFCCVVVERLRHVHLKMVLVLLLATE